MDSPRSLQERYSPEGICFGCGVANDQGLRIRSFSEGDELVCTWTPKRQHDAFPGVLSGGVIGTLLDCHGVWTMVHGLLVKRGLDQAPAVVTSELSVSFKRPTPSAGSVSLRTSVVEWKDGDNIAVVEGTLEAEGKVRATLRGTFVAVKPGHPAFHRW